MPSDNEFRKDEKLYIKQIKKCSCDRKLGDIYRVRCKIIQRGEKLYLYKAGADFIAKDIIDGERMYLCPEAKKTVEKSVSDFEEWVYEARNSFIDITIPGIPTDIYYERIGLDVYNLMTISHGDGEEDIIISQDISLRDIIFKLIFEKNISENKEIEKLISNPDEETIKTHPLYMSAVEQGDELMQKKLKLLFHCETKEDCEWLSEVLNTKVLPRLSKEFDKDYFVDSDNITEDDLHLLERSGFVIMHRPYFAMPGSTHSMWSLNPHRKSGTDAVRVGQEAITFADFMKFYDVENGDT